MRNEDFRRNRGPRADGESRHVHVPRYGRVGGRRRSSGTGCSSSATTRTRRTSGPLHTFSANTGGEPVGGNVTRVLASDLDALSTYLTQNFRLRDRPFENLPAETPAKRYLIRGDHNLNNGNKISFRYNQLDSSACKVLSGVGVGRPGPDARHQLPPVCEFELRAAREHQVGRRRVELGHRQEHVDTASWRATRPTTRTAATSAAAFHSSTSSRPTGRPTASFGSEPFTPNNELTLPHDQIQDNFTKFGNQPLADVRLHDAAVQVATTRSSTAASRAPTSTARWPTSTPTPTAIWRTRTARRRAITPRRFQVRWMNIPGLRQADPEAEGRERRRVRAGRVAAAAQSDGHGADIRFDVPSFDRHQRIPNPNADALTFRDETGCAGAVLERHPARCQDTRGRRASASTGTSPAISRRSSAAAPASSPVRRSTSGSRTSSATPACSRARCSRTIRRRAPFNPNVERYRPANVTGAPAASYELNVTDNDFKFPQVWRTNLAVDRRLPGGMTGTAEFVYNKDVNGIYYINANLPAAQSAFTGVDARPAGWTACAAPTAVRHRSTSRRQPGHRAIVMKNQSVGNRGISRRRWRSRCITASRCKGAYSYGDAKNTIDPGSTASRRSTSTSTRAIPTTRASGARSGPGTRVFVQTPVQPSYFGFGATTISAFLEAKPR